MRYEEPLYRPPSEAESLLIQCTIGCPHNKCTFCGMYKRKRFRIRKPEEIKEDLRTARKIYGPLVRSIFLPDGNTVIMRTEKLCEILRFARSLFPRLQRITTYGSAKFLVRKSIDELVALREAGLSRIHSGMESGDAVTLERIRKGATPEQMVEAGGRVKEAGIELSEYIMIGIAGRDRRRRHAEESARLLNAVEPDFVRIRTYVPVPGTPLWRRWREGAFVLPEPHEAIEEMRLLVENLNCRTLFLTDHVSNYAFVEGRLPEDKPRMLAALDEAAKLPREAFRPQIIHRL